MTLSPDDSTSAYIRTSQIVAASLMMGVSTFLVMAIAIRSGKGVFAAEPWDVLPQNAMLSFLGLAMAAMMLVASVLIPKGVSKNLRTGVVKAKSAGISEPGAGDPAFFGMYNTQMIVGMALLEGAAFFNVIAFLCEGRIPSLIAAVTLVLFILARFPTQDKVEAWIEVQKDLIREERNAA